MKICPLRMIADHSTERKLDVQCMEKECALWRTEIITEEQVLGPNTKEIKYCGLAGQPK